MASGFTDFFALNGCSSSPQSCAPPPSPILQLVTLLHSFPPVFRHRTPTGLRPREFLPLLEYPTLTGDGIFDDGFDGTQNPVPRSTSPLDRGPWDFSGGGDNKYSAPTIGLTERLSPPSDQAVRIRSGRATLGFGTGRRVFRHPQIPPYRVSLNL